MKCWLKLRYAKNNEINQWSGSELSVSSGGFVSTLNFQSFLDFFSQPQWVFGDVLKTADSGCSGIKAVDNPVVTAIARNEATDPGSKETVPYAQEAFFNGFVSVTKLTLVADWGAKSPSAGLLVMDGEAAGFPAGPAAVAISNFAGYTGAEAAYENLAKGAVGSTHFEKSNKNKKKYLSTTSAISISDFIIDSHCSILWFLTIFISHCGWKREVSLFLTLFWEEIALKLRPLAS